MQDIHAQKIIILDFFSQFDNNNNNNKNIKITNNLKNVDLDFIKEYVGKNNSKVVHLKK